MLLRGHPTLSHVTSALLIMQWILYPYYYDYLGVVRCILRAATLAGAGSHQDPLSLTLPAVYSKQITLTVNAENVFSFSCGAPSSSSMATVIQFRGLLLSFTFLLIDIN